MEIAKRYGEEQTPRFVNGILDQVRRNLNIPFN
jgi:transcription termination factor NusB